MAPIRLLDYFFINRPILFFPGWNTLIIGFLAVTGQLAIFQDIRGLQIIFWDKYLAILMFIFALSMGGSFIFNQLKDIETDKKNKKLFLIGENYIPFKFAVAEAFLLIALSLLLSFSINLNVLLVNILFVIVTAYLYNYPPFEYKNKPFMGLLMNMLMGWAAFILGWSLLQPWSLQMILLSIPYLAINTGLYLLTTVPDENGDRHANKITLSVAYGIDKIIFSFIGLYVIGLAIAVLNGDHFFLLFNVPLIYWVYGMFKHRDRFWILKTIKMSIFFCTILIFIKLPTYFLLITAVFFLTKYYYKARFNFDYPNLKGE